jgi:hypothetical protein
VTQFLTLADAYVPPGVWTQCNSYGFDTSVWEIWGSLLHGGRVVVVPESVAAAPQDFHALIVSERVSLLTWTPSAAGTNQITVRVTDSGSPALSATTTFTIAVMNTLPRLTVTQNDTTITLTWPKSADYRLHTRTDLGTAPVPPKASDLSWTLYTGTVTDDGTTCTTVVNKPTTGSVFFLLK